MKLSRAYNIDDLRVLAARRLPNFIMDFIDGGVEDEHNVALNETALRAYRLMPQLLIDVSGRTQKTTVFGQTFASPFGIAPTGSGPLYRRDADFLLARAAVAADIPFVLSGCGGASLEDIRRETPIHSWYQLYGARDRSITKHVVGRVVDAGYDVLVMTVDNPITPKRERHLRSGATVPLKLTPRLMLHLVQQALLHPAWFIEYLQNGGMPRLETWAAYAPEGSSNVQIASFYRSQSPWPQTWRDLEAVRRQWPGKLVLKGVLNPADAARAVEMGVDGIWVSNHGGKMLDRAPATIQVLPAVKAAVAGRALVFMDGGIRRGSDIVVARCLGADMVFTGRAMLYGLAAGGVAGVARSIEILRNEVDLVLGTIGCTAFDDLDASRVIPPDDSLTAPARLPDLSPR